MSRQQFGFVSVALLVLAPIAATAQLPNDTAPGWELLVNCPTGANQVFVPPRYKTCDEAKQYVESFYSSSCVVGATSCNQSVCSSVDTSPFLAFAPPNSGCVQNVARMFARCADGFTALLNRPGFPRHPEPQTT